MASDTKTERINWLAILRGMTIMFVVMNHIQLLDTSTGENHQFIETINYWLHYLRIPTFVFVSGTLLYYTRINKGWNVPDLYKDKFTRIGLPLIFCTCLGTIMQIMFNGVVKTPHPVTLESFFRSFVVIEGSPWPHRWYLMTLLTLMLLYPLYISIKKRSLSYILLVVLFLFQKTDLTGISETNWFHIFSINRYIPFFVLGIVSCHYGWWTKILEHTKIITPLSWILYVIMVIMDKFFQINEFFPFCELIGILSMMSTAMLIDKFVPSLFHSFRNYIFPIYLFGIAFQAFVELIVWRGLGCPEQLVIPFYFINLGFGIYCPVLISKIVERIPVKFIRQCFGIK